MQLSSAYSDFISWQNTAAPDFVERTNRIASHDPGINHFPCPGQKVISISSAYSFCFPYYTCPIRLPESIFFKKGKPVSRQNMRQREQFSLPQFGYQLSKSLYSVTGFKQCIINVASVYVT